MEGRQCLGSHRGRAGGRPQVQEFITHPPILLPGLAWVMPAAPSSIPKGKRKWGELPQVRDTRFSPTNSLSHTCSSAGTPSLREKKSLPPHAGLCVCVSGGLLLLFAKKEMEAAGWWGEGGEPIN